jgi:hypothetical protein
MADTSLRIAVFLWVQGYFHHFYIGKPQNNGYFYGSLMTIVIVNVKLSWNALLNIHLFNINIFSLLYIITLCTIIV